MRACCGQTCGWNGYRVLGVHSPSRASRAHRMAADAGVVQRGQARAVVRELSTEACKRTARRRDGPPTNRAVNCPRWSHRALVGCAQSWTGRPDEDSSNAHHGWQAPRACSPVAQATTKGSAGEGGVATILLRRRGQLKLLSQITSARERQRPCLMSPGRCKAMQRP
jgi:hypothetical protein